MLRRFARAKLQSADFPSRRTLPRPALSLPFFFLLLTHPHTCVYSQTMQAHPPPLEPQTEHGLDGWHVWGPRKNLLFYSKHPVVKVPTNANGHRANEGSEAQHREINIENISQDSWTDLMKRAHQEVPPFFFRSLADEQS